MQKVKSKWFAAALSAALLQLAGFAVAQSSMTCTCGGQTYRGSCPAGQKAVSCDCKSITLICQKVAPAAKPAAATGAADDKAKAKPAAGAKVKAKGKQQAKPAQKSPQKSAQKKAAKKPAKKPPSKGAPAKSANPA